MQGSIMRARHWNIMNFSVASEYGVFGAVVIVFMAVIGIGVVFALLRTVFSGRKSIQEIEADQIEDDLPIESDARPR
jgi:hypothetical protein